MDSTKDKIAIGAAVMAAWAVLVVLKMTPPQPFVDMLRDVLVGLGMYHITTNNKGQS